MSKSDAKVIPARYRIWLNRSQVAECVGRSRQTIWCWDRAGILPKPDGRDPFGNPLWRDSTIDAFLSGARGAA